MNTQRKQITLVLDVSDAKLLHDGVFVTNLTHPKLKGELSFVHSAEGGKEEFLKSLDQNIVSSILDAVNTIGGFIDGPQPQKSPSTVTTTSGDKT